MNPRGEFRTVIDTQVCIPELGPIYNTFSWITEITSFNTSSSTAIVTTNNKWSIYSCVTIIC